MRGPWKRSGWGITAWGVGALGISIGLLFSTAWGKDLQNGKKVYVDQCLKCHGERGKGDGPDADDLEKKPMDYTDKAKMSKFTDAQLVEVVRDGKKPMPAYKKKLTPKEMEDVIAYIRTFAGK